MKLYKDRGMMLPEFIAAVLVAVLAVAGAMAVYLMCVTAWQESSAQIAIQRQARAVMERMARGVRASGENKKNGIREASSASISGSSTVLFTSGVDAVERSFYLQGSRIFYDPDTSASGDEISITEDVSSLQFQLSGTDQVNIDLTLQRTVRGRAIAVNIMTDVKLRN